MRALIFDSSLRLTTRPDPLPREGEALIKILYSSICNNDLEIIKGYMGFQGIPGHEFVGKVVNKENRFYGQRVVGEINCSCGNCLMCRTKRRSHSACIIHEKGCQGGGLYRLYW